MRTEFKNIGFFIEYFINRKFLGSIKVQEPDREIIGYYGRIDSVAEKDIILDNKKRIKKGSHYYTRLYPLCGEKK